MRKIPETIKEEELKKLIEGTKKHHHKLCWKLGFYQCLRVSEVRKLLPENVKRNERLLLIKQAKGNKDRNIAIAPEIVRDLKHLPVGIGDRAIQKAFKRRAKEILNKDLYFHQLRHSGATWYHTVKGWDIRMLQTFLGHSRIDTTEIYTHVSPDDMVRKMWGEG